MIALNDAEEISIFQSFPRREGNLIDTMDVKVCEQLKGDGSNRRIWRLTTFAGQELIVVAPESEDDVELAESAAAWHIGLHLQRNGIPVPHFFGFEENTGILLCEDLGDRHLQQVAMTTDYTDDVLVGELRHLYRQVLDTLISMQVNGRNGFSAHWCWDTPRYDKEVMLERESGYFVRAFWQGLLNQEIPTGLEKEFRQLAEISATANPEYFLHRDFQSRNIMIKHNRVRIIDFQGGRFGPLGYDLASLLLDPYAALPLWFQEELYQYYLSRLQVVEPVDSEEFFIHFQALRLQRNLQIIGAFSFLSTVRGKSFFFDYIEPALHSLKRNLYDFSPFHFPVLKYVSQEGLKLFCSLATDL